MCNCSFFVGKKKIDFLIRAQMLCYVVIRIDALFFWSYVHVCDIFIRLFVCYLYGMYVLKVRINMILIMCIGLRASRHRFRPQEENLQALK